MERKLLRIEKVAEMLDVSETTVKRLVKEGKLPKPRHIRTQARWFVRDVENYLRRLDRGEFEGEDVPDDENASGGSNLGPKGPKGAKRSER